MLLRFLSYGFFGWCAEIVWTALYDAISGTRRAAEGRPSGTGSPSAQGSAGVERVAVSRATRLRLEGKTYLWMLPIYGGGGLLFERAHALVAAWPWLVRGAVYCAGAFVVEAAGGWFLKLATGRIPWDYSYARASALGGAIRLDYAPVWFVFGLVLERVEIVVRAIEPVLNF
jgi:hypothetical protein